MADALVVLVLAVTAIAEHFGPPHRIHALIDVVFMSVVLGALLFRRVRPLLAFIALVSTIFLWERFGIFDPEAADFCAWVAAYAVAVWRGAWWGTGAVGVVVLIYGWPSYDYWIVGWGLNFVFAVLAGVAVRQSRTLIAELREQTELLRRTRTERVQLAVDEERTRIARDVHDLVAHGVTLMVIQAGAARWLAESDPHRADEALQSVEKAGADALREMHALFGSKGGDSSDRAESLLAGAQLSIHSLVDHEIGAGMHVELVVEGGARELDGGLEISLYRIVQEALMNVRKHAPGARACVELRYTPDGVEAEVTDSGGSTVNELLKTVPGAGQGLIGIVERAALFGGHAEAGPTPEGGFRVRASLHQERVLV